jgi:hypothetical protein
VTWKKAGDKFTAVWKIKVKKGVRLPPAEKARKEAELKKWFGGMVSTYDGGFFEDADETKVAFDVSFFGDEPEPPPVVKPKKPKVKDVTTADLRKHVEKFFGDEKNAAKFEYFSAFFDLGPDALTWKRQGDRYVAEWRIKPKKGVKLSREQWTKKAAELKDWFNQGINKFTGEFFDSGEDMVAFDIGFDLPAEEPPVIPKRPRKKVREVTTFDLRQHVGRYFDEHASTWRQEGFGNMFDLGFEGLEWRREGNRFIVAWRLKTRRGVRLTQTQILRVTEDLKRTLRKIVNEYNEGLFEDADKVTMDWNVTIRQDEEGGGGTTNPVLPRPTTLPGTTSTSTGQRYHLWYWVSYGCGCGYSGYWVYGGTYTAASSTTTAAPAPQMRSAPAPAPAPRGAPVRGTRVDRGEDARSEEAALPSAPPRRMSAPRATLDTRGLKTTGQELYWHGYKLYWESDYAEAWKYFEAATRMADDARYWYYRALSERALGDEAARESLLRGAELERQGKPHGDQVGLALERIQGPVRTWLRSVERELRSVPAPAERVVGR